LTVARQGILSEAALANLPTDVKESCLIRQQAGYQLVSSLRYRVFFAMLSAYCHPPFLKLDLISCRDLLPLATIGASTLPALFYEASNPGGLLLLNPSESPDRFTEGFEAYDYDKANQRCLRRTTGSAALAFAAETPAP